MLLTLRAQRFRPKDAMQILLKDEAGQKELDTWPQYQGRLVPGPSNRNYLHMNTLQYFLLWTAFYVLRSGQSSTGQSSSSRRPVFASATFGNMRKVECTTLVTFSSPASWINAHP